LCGGESSLKKISLDKMNEVRPILVAHRGIKEMVGNIALAILGLGIFYGIAVAVNSFKNNKFPAGL